MWCYLYWKLIKSLVPVSYTHLDVYKRQEHTSLFLRCSGLYKNKNTPYSLWLKVGYVQYYSMYHTRNCIVICVCTCVYTKIVSTFVQHTRPYRIFSTFVQHTRTYKIFSTFVQHTRPYRNFPRKAVSYTLETCKIHKSSV